MPMDKVTIKIPRPLYDRIQQIITHSGFSSPTDFIVYILRDLVGQMGTGPGQDQLSKEEMEAIRRRLKGLGYL
jgi:Arc/MetJ-type ribon-helix-helix transcriptional regulator